MTAWINALVDEMLDRVFGPMPVKPCDCPKCVAWRAARETEASQS